MGSQHAATSHRRPYVGQMQKPSGGCTPCHRVGGFPCLAILGPALGPSLSLALSRVDASSRNSHVHGPNPLAVDHLMAEGHPKLQSLDEAHEFVGEVVVAVEQQETSGVDVPFRGHGHGHDRGRVDVPCFLNVRVRAHARPQEVDRVQDPAEVPWLGGGLVPSPSLCLYPCLFLSPCCPCPNRGL